MSCENPASGYTRGYLCFRRVQLRPEIMMPHLGWYCRGLHRLCVLELFSHDLPEASGQDPRQNFVICV